MNAFLVFNQKVFVLRWISQYILCLLWPAKVFYQTQKRKCIRADMRLASDVRTHAVLESELSDADEDNASHLWVTIKSKPIINFSQHSFSYTQLYVVLSRTKRSPLASFSISVMRLIACNPTTQWTGVYRKFTAAIFDTNRGNFSFSFHLEILDGLGSDSCLQIIFTNFWLMPFFDIIIVAFDIENDGIIFWVRVEAN